jgi:hypothetical protein
MASLKWRYFAGAAIFVGYFLLANGVSIIAVAIGIALAAMWNWFERRRA